MEGIQVSKTKRRHSGEYHCNNFTTCWLGMEDILVSKTKRKHGSEYHCNNFTLWWLEMEDILVRLREDIVVSTTAATS